MDTLEAGSQVDQIDIERIMDMIPHRYPFLMIDRVIDIVPNVKATGVFLDDGTLVYHGRIDDRYVDLTRRRAKASQHDVIAVLDALLAGKDVDPTWSPAAGRSLKTMSQPAVGCFIKDFK